jgi:flagellar motor switch protein FliN
MSPTAELSQLTADDVLAACGQNAAEIAATLGRTLDVTLTVALGEPGDYRVQSPPPELLSGGLAVVLAAGPWGAVFAVPERSGLLPDWSGQPDATGTARLETLAQELSMLLMPDSVMADQFKAGRVGHLGTAIGQAKLPDTAHHVKLELKADDGRAGPAFLVWPVAAPTSVFAASPAPAKPKPQAPAKPKRPPSASAMPPIRLSGIIDLPVYSQSLLKIQLPVVVTLARKRQPLGRIVELGPGSIIQFEKSCEEMLELEVGGRNVAAGEAVKVGDKFGLRITSMILPGERFKKLGPQPAK